MRMNGCAVVGEMRRLRGRGKTLENDSPCAERSQWSRHRAERSQFARRLRRTKPITPLPPSSIARIRHDHAPNEPNIHALIEANVYLCQLL